MTMVWTAVSMAWAHEAQSPTKPTGYVIRIIYSWTRYIVPSKRAGSVLIFPTTLTATLIKSSIRDHEPRTLDWGDMMTYSLYLGHESK